ncbi:MAG: HAD hydrolase-like protein [Candidatus Pacebacteria bacterium]|nr:HAD hydrolase-like protein [Candidatus Paceibacterota bacterium]
MANLNQHDILFINSKKFKGFSELIEKSYNFKILSYDLPPFISFTSRKAVLTTDKGVFFLKEKPLYCSDNISRNIAANFQLFLSKNLNYIPSILSTRNKKLYIEWKNRFFFLTEFKKGRVFNGSSNDIKNILKVLRCFQDVAATFKIQNLVVKKTESYKVIPCVSLIEEYVYTKSDKLLFRRITNVIENLKSQYNTVKKTNYVMSHGDFALFNVILNKRKVVAINDFDNACYLPRIHDLAEFLVSATLVYYIGPLTNLNTPVFVTPKETVFNQILNYYLTHFNLQPEDILLLPIIAEIVWLEILLLAVMKEDYTLSDITPAIKKLEKNILQSKINSAIQKSNKKVFIWDFHGTLETGTIYILTEIANILLKENGSKKQYSPLEISSISGFSWNVFFKSNFPNFSEKKIQNIVESVYNEKKFKTINQKYSKPNNNAKSLLRTIKECGGINIVVSYSRQNKLKKYISQIGLEELIDEYHGVDDNTLKSKQDILKKKSLSIKSILKKYPGYKTYAVGDTGEDFNAARISGIDKFFWLLSKDDKKTKQQLYKNIDSKKLQFIFDLEEIKEVLSKVISNKKRTG